MHPTARFRLIRYAKVRQCTETIIPPIYTFDSIFSQKNLQFF